MILRSRNPFSLRDLAFSHGWIALPPWSWQADPPALRRVERLPSGAVVSLQIASADPDAPTDEFSVTAPEGAGLQVLGSRNGPTVESLPECGPGPLREPLSKTPAAAEADLVRTPASLPPLGAGPGSALSGNLRGPDPHCLPSAGLSAADYAALEEPVRWMLRLDEDFSEFHALLRTLPGCEQPASRGEGRLLRSWDFFEDAVKTICTTNTTWSQTQSMIARLVERYGQRGGDAIAFPEPERLAAAPEAELQESGLGYRASAVRRLADAVAAGELPREASDWAALPSPELHRRLLALRGIGPYAAGNLLMLLGHYDRLAIDSWLRRAVREAWFEGTPATDREIEAKFAEFGRWRALVYWFHPALHPGRDAWR